MKKQFAMGVQRCAAELRVLPTRFFAFHIRSLILFRFIETCTKRNQWYNVCLAKGTL